MNISVKFDLSPDGEYCDGILSLIGEEITAKFDEKIIFCVSIKGVREIVLRTYVGCGMIELVPEDSSDNMDNSIEVCRFSLSCVDEVGEFCKVINHYLKYNEETDINTSGFRVCPKCGRHYAKGVNTCLFCVEKSYLIKKLATISKPYISWLLFCGLFVLLSSACSALIPVLNKNLIDNYLINPELSSNNTVVQIIKYVGIIALFQIMAKLFGAISNRRANKIGGSISNDLRIMVYDKTQRLSVSSVAGKTSGDLMKRISRDTEIVKNFITEQGIYALEKVIMFIVILVVLLKISPLLTAIILVPVPAVMFAISKYWSKIRVRYEKQWRSDSRANSILHDIIKGIRVVKTFGSEKREIEKFAYASKKLADISVSNEHVWAVVFPFLTLFMGIGEFLVIYFGGRMVISGTISIGELLAFNLYLAYIYQPLRWMTTLPRRLGEVTTSLIKIFEIIDEKHEIADAENPVPADLNGDIVFKNVQFGYKPYEPVLRDINLNVKQGEMIGLVGHSGAGKSTLINLVLRLYDPDSGEILINNTNIKQISQTEYREKVGVVFQETFLFSGSIYDNIAYAKPSAKPSEIIAAAKAANAHDFIMNLSDGYNTIIGEDGHTLSGGERQRVSIARAVLRNPELLILDEATSALDPNTEEAIQDALSRLVKGRTTFAIAHRLSTLRNATRLIVIEKGKIAETGTHDELLKQNGIYASLVSAQRETSKLEN